jgi:hypothetical protein
MANFALTQWASGRCFRDQQNVLASIPICMLAKAKELFDDQHQREGGSALLLSYMLMRKGKLVSTHFQQQRRRNNPPDKLESPSSCAFVHRLT